MLVPRVQNVRELPSSPAYLPEFLAESGGTRTEEDMFASNTKKNLMQ